MREGAKFKKTNLIKILTISGNSKDFSFTINFFKSPPSYLLFRELEPHAKFYNPRTTPSERKVCVVVGWSVVVVEGKLSVTLLSKLLS